MISVERKEVFFKLRDQMNKNQYFLFEAKANFSPIYQNPIFLAQKIDSTALNSYLDTTKVQWYCQMILQLVFIYGNGLVLAFRVIQQLLRKKNGHKKVNSIFSNR